MTKSKFRPWLKSYPNGVESEADIELFGSILDLFEYSCEKYADNYAYTSMRTKITYDELYKKSVRFAAFLQCKLKLKKGDKIALMLPNIIQYPVALFGSLLAGCTVINVNPMYKSSELVHQLKDSGAKTIIVISNFAHTLQRALHDIELDNIIITELGDECGALKGTLINFAVRHLKRLVPRFKILNTISYKQALLEGENFPYTRPVVYEKDLAFLQYTGGTTGQAKGAMLTHRNILANVAQAFSMYGKVLNEGKEVLLTAIPLYHVFALTVNCFLSLRIGGDSVLVADPRNIKNLVKVMSQSNITIMTGVNTLFNALINNEKFCQTLLPSLRLVIGGGTSVQKSVADRWFIHTGLQILEGYGLTECSPLVSVCPHTQKEFNGTIGIPVPSTEVIIKDGDGNIITEVNIPGELLVKGPQVMLGYYGREVATNGVFDGEYLKTGDIACWANEQGYIKLVDRQKDLIIVSGFNVYPSEIEEVIMLHPNVLECAVIGVPSERSGEKVKAFIVKKHKSLTEEMILTMCKKHLTAYKVPKEIEFIDSMPKTAVGKVKRRELRKRVLGKSAKKK